MKKRIVILLTVCLFLSVCTFGCADDKSATPGTETTVAEYKYRLKDYKGRLALYQNGNDTPTEIYDIFTESLPVYDAKILKSEGIKAKDEKELKIILDNYLS